MGMKDIVSEAKKLDQPKPPRTSQVEVSPDASAPESENDPKTEPQAPPLESSVPPSPPALSVPVQVAAPTSRSSRRTPPKPADDRVRKIETRHAAESYGDIINAVGGPNSVTPVRITHRTRDGHLAECGTYSVREVLAHDNTVSGFMDAYIKPSYGPGHYQLEFQIKDNPIQMPMTLGGAEPRANGAGISINTSPDVGQQTKGFVEAMKSMVEVVNSMISRNSGQNPETTQLVTSLMNKVLDQAKTGEATKDPMQMITTIHALNMLQNQMKPAGIDPAVQEVLGKFTRMTEEYVSSMARRPVEDRPLPPRLRLMGDEPKTDTAALELIRSIAPSLVEAINRKPDFNFKDVLEVVGRKPEIDLPGILALIEKRESSGSSSMQTMITLLQGQTTAQIEGMKTLVTTMMAQFQESIRQLTEAHKEKKDDKWETFLVEEFKDMRDELRDLRSGGDESPLDSAVKAITALKGLSSTAEELVGNKRAGLLERLLGKAVDALPEFLGAMQKAARVGAFGNAPALPPGYVLVRPDMMPEPMTQAAPPQFYPVAPAPMGRTAPPQARPVTIQRGGLTTPQPSPQARPVTTRQPIQSPPSSLKPVAGTKDAAPKKEEGSPKEATGKKEKGDTKKGKSAKEGAPVKQSPQAPPQPAPAAALDPSDALLLVLADPNTDDNAIIGVAVQVLATAWATPPHGYAQRDAMIFAVQRQDWTRLLEFVDQMLEGIYGGNERMTQEAHDRLIDVFIRNQALVLGLLFGPEA